MKSRLIAISAISSALVALCLILGVFFNVADVFMLLISSAFVILPLYCKSYKACFLTYLAGGVVGLLLGFSSFTVTFIFPAYFAYFGIFPIISCVLREKRVSKILSVTIGIIWSIAVFYGIYFYCLFIIGLDTSDVPYYLRWISDNIIYIMGIFGVIFYFVYDRFVFVVKVLIDRYLHKIIK